MLVLAVLFLGGILGNITASCFWDVGKFAFRPLLEKAPSIGELLSQGGTNKNHDLLRAMRRSECLAVCAILDQTLLDDYGLRSGQGPLLSRVSARLKERSEPDFALLCELRRQFRSRAAEVMGLPLEDLAKTKVKGIDLLDVAEVISTGSEILQAQGPTELCERSVNTYLKALENSIWPARALPKGFKRRFSDVETGWFSLLRVYFREELKTNDKARIAFELDCQSLIPEMLGKPFSEIYQRLDKQDALLTATLNGLEDFRRQWDEAIEQIVSLLEESNATAQSTHALVRDIHGVLVKTNVQDIADQPSAVRPKYSNLPGSIGGLFKGRADFLRKLQRALEAAPEGHATAVSTPHAIHGLGGVGKTRVAVEYGLRHWDDYTALLLVRADSPEALHRNLADLTGAVVADLKEFTGSEQEVRLAALLRWLERHPRWFLILDNVDSETAARGVENFLGRLRGGRVLITTRVRGWSRQVEPLELELLDEAAAVAFLEESTRQRARTATDAEDARALAQELDGLALGLEQAGAYIDRKHLSFGAYLRRWRQGRQPVLEWFDERLMGYPASVAITWQTTFDQLGGPARALLGLLSYFASAPIPRGVLETEPTPGILTAALATIAGESSGNPPLLSADEVDDSLAELAHFSLVRFLETSPETFSLHRLVQEVARSRLGEAARQRCEQALELVQAYAPGDARDASTWPQWAALAPHLETLFEATKEWAEPSPQLANLLTGFADYLRYRGAAVAATVGYYERALALHRQLGDRGAEGHDLLGLGYCRSTQGDNAQAREHSLRALEIHRSMGNPRGEGDARRILGYVYSALSNFPEAIAEFEKARTIHRNIGYSRGEGDAWCGIGTPLWDSGRFKAAEEAYQQAMRIYRAAQDIADEADAVNGLGWCCWAQGKYRQAIGHFENALAIHRAIDDRGGITANLCGLGDAWTSLGDLDRGTAFLREGLEVCRNSKDDYWEGCCLWGLAYASQQAGDHRTAIGILEPDLKLMRERADQRGIACDLNSLGASYIKLGEIAPARACFEEALTISRAIGERWGEALALHGLGRLDQAAGGVSLAVTRYEQALEVIRLVGELPRERDILRDLGEALAALGQTERAADCLAQAERLSRQLEEWNRLPDQ